MIRLSLIKQGTLFEIRKFIPFFLLFLLSQNILAGEIYDLSRCILTGLEQNFSIKLARNQEEISANNYSRGNAGYLPEITANNFFGGTVNTTDQSLRDGNENTDRNMHNISGSVGLNMNMTIFNGFNVQTSYQKLNELKQMGALNTQMDIENLVAEIIVEYYSYIQQLNLYENMEYAMKLSRERVRIDEERYLLGASSKLDLLQSVVYLNADSSRYSKQHEVLRTSLVRLKKLMAAKDLREEIILQDTSIRVNPGLNYEDLLETTLASNTSLQVAKKDQVISELDYKIIASRSYPYLNLSSGYTWSYNGYEEGSVKNQQTREMDYGLSMGIDLFDGYNRRREKANAMIEIENRKYQYQEVEQDVKADLLTIYYAYENNLQLLQLEEQNLDVARENLGIALERYKLGDLSGLELREVQKSLLDAEERLISVKYETKLAEISLLLISGRIMDYA